MKRWRRKPVFFDGVALAAEGWSIEPLHLDEVPSSLFDNRDPFRAGTAVADSAFLTTDLDTTWRPSRRWPPSRSGCATRAVPGNHSCRDPPWLHGVALVVGVSGVLLAVVASRAPGRLRLFLRCLRWGVGTGAATGALIGAMVLLSSGIGDGPSLVDLTPAGALYGAVAGVLVSLIPSLVGAAAITGLMGRRYRQPLAEEHVRSDLTSILGVVVALLDAAVVVGLAVSGAGVSSAAVALPFIVAGNACVVLMLCRARRSIARLWWTTGP